MKKIETLGKKLTKEQQKTIAGGFGDGGGSGCLSLGADCNDSVQCCSNNCAAAGGSSTGKVCKVSS